MNYEIYNEETIRSFLLGRLSTEKEEEIEIRLLVDPELQTVAEIAEYDLIDDYVRGALEGYESVLFERNFLISTERREKLRAAYIFKSSTGAAEKESIPNRAPDRLASIYKTLVRKPEKRLFDWRWAIPLLALALVAIGLGPMARRLLFTSPVDQAVAALKRAYAQERPIESRLSGFNHAPWVVRRSDEASSANFTLRDEAARTLLREVNSHPSARAQQALGSLYILEQNMGEAIKQLEMALKANPDNALIHNDFGAALMELAKSQKEKEARSETKIEQGEAGSLLTFGRANEHFAQALQKNPALAEAQFNQAVCLQHIGLVNQAMEAWKKYLALDSTSEWAKEARRRLAEMEEQKKKMARNREQITEEFLAAAQSGDEKTLWQTFNSAREYTGNFITHRLLDEYLTLSEQRRTAEAFQRLALLAKPAEIERQRGDLFLRDLLAFYQNINASQRGLLLSARRQFKEAAELNRAEKPEALGLYEKAKVLFNSAGDSWEAGLAQCQILRLQVQTYSYRDASSTAEFLVDFATVRQYRWLLTQTYLWLADLHIGLKKYSQALAHSTQALSLLESLADSNGEFLLRLQQAYEFHLMGDPKEALSRLARILTSRRPDHATIYDRWFSCGAASDSFNELNLLYTAIACEQEALQFAREMNNPVLQSRSYAYIGEMYGKLGDMKEAITHVMRARMIGQEMGENTKGRDVVEHATLRLGHLYRKQADWDQALVCYEESARLSDGMRKVYDNLDIFRGKLLVYLARHDTAATQRELQAALQLFEESVANVNQENLRNSFFDTGQEIYDLAIQFAADYQRDPQQAFNYSERGRARTLQDLLKERKATSSTAGTLSLRGLSDSLSLPEIKRRMPPNAQIVQYAMLSNALHIWLVSRESFRHVVRPIPLEDLNAKIVFFLEGLAQTQGLPGQEAKNSANELYDILIGPIADSLDPYKELCIVPDESLNYLPFSALIESGSGRYLIENFTIVYSPSATIYLACTDIAARKSMIPVERCVSLGHPRFDRDSYPKLPDLPSTEKEAKEVAEFYPIFLPLLADGATESALRREANNAEVVHIASHGLINTQRPGYSGIVLAREQSGASSAADGILHADEVCRMYLPRTKLVVLSACQTWLGHNYRGEGMAGLARAFIVADVPLVVASLWAVNSELTYELMRSFHRHRKTEGGSTARALRDAQLEMLRRQSSENRPNVWAAFIVVGGHANF
jgi:CHAT domain-containing protein